MSFTQDYKIPTLIELYEEMLGESAEAILRERLEMRGIHISDIKTVEIDKDLYRPVKGFLVTLADHTRYIPKLVRTETSGGNWAVDIYEWWNYDESPRVEVINRDMQ